LVRLVDGVDLNGTSEADADIETTLNFYAAAAPTAFGAANGPGYICYTPLGRSYVNIQPLDNKWFDNRLPNISPLEAVVQRLGGGGSNTVRSVLVPPSGMARIFSHVI
jgi:hypothetical protein